VLIAWGDEAFRRKEYAAAEWHYRLYLTVETRRNVASVFLYRVMALFHLNRFRDIISLADEIKELNADDYTRRQVSLWLGRSYYRTGNPELAYKTLFTGKLGDLEPDDLIILARCALEIGDIWTAQAVPALLANDKERYGESLFILGQYHAPDNQQAAMDFFTKVITDCPDSGFADPARMELSELFVKNRRFAEAVANLDEIKDEKLLDRRNALLIISFFRTGKIQRAIELTRKNIPKLLGLPHGEAVVKENLFYYFLNRDVENFTLYSGYMGRYPGTGALVNYLSGKLYFEVGRYSTSYYYFYKLTHAESEYKDEALYNLAVISLYDQKNRNLAIAYFKKLAESADTGNAVVLKAKMNLAILLNEKGDIPASRNTLKEISEGPENVVIKTQAENLWNYFGYTK
jgi:tetratricopeptide (TPR) repeat protein